MTYLAWLTMLGPTKKSTKKHQDHCPTGILKTRGTTTTIFPQNRFVGSNLSPTVFGDQIQVLASMKIKCCKWLRCGFCEEAPNPPNSSKKQGTMNLGNLDKLSKWVIIPTCPAVKHVSTVILAYPKRQTPISGKVARQIYIFQIFFCSKSTKSSFWLYDTTQTPKNTIPTKTSISFLFFRDGLWIWKVVFSPRSQLQNIANRCTFSLG